MTDKPIPAPSPNWPEDQLEQLTSCPVCSNTVTKSLYSGLTDRVMFCAPGTWTIFRCNQCGAAYLNPRPSPESIGLAYQSYYTHTRETNDNHQQLPAGNLRYALRNGYLNSRYHYTLKPALRIGGVFAYAFPTRRVREDRWVRHLEKKHPSPGLLDIGCADGSFLKRMGSLGWQVTGIDIDPQSIQIARKKGLQVYQGNLNSGFFPPDSFDAITLNHVLEHLYDPVDTLKICYQILRPGGVIWIATPNLDSYGHKRFGPAWLGLDPPRHLSLFTYKCLASLLKQCGFTSPKRPLAYPMSEWMFQSGQAIQNRLDPFTPLPKLSFRKRVTAMYIDYLTWLKPSLAEEVVVFAKK